MKSVVARNLKLGNTAVVKKYFTSAPTAPQSIGLQKYLDTINKKPFDDVKTKVWSSTPIHMDLATHLVGAVLGYEGEKVFPSVFNPPTYIPSQITLDSVRTAVLKEMNSRSDSATFQKLDSVTAKGGQNELRSTGLSKEVLYLVYHELNANKQCVFMPQVTVAAGWTIDNLWVQVSGVADLCIYGTEVIHGPEPFSFASVSVAPMTLDARSLLVGSAANQHPSKGKMEFLGAPSKSCFTVLDHGPEMRDGRTDSQALLYCASSLINQAIQHKIDTPQLGFTVMTDGRVWRFVALQLNTLDFEAAVSNPAAPKNAVWVYESELFTDKAMSDHSTLKINHEPLCILRDILRACSEETYSQQGLV